MHIHEGIVHERIVPILRSCIVLSTFRAQKACEFMVLFGQVCIRVTARSGHEKTRMPGHAGLAIMQICDAPSRKGQPIAFTREERREILREEVFL